MTSGERTRRPAAKAAGETKKPSKRTQRDRAKAAPGERTPKKPPTTTPPSRSRSRRRAGVPRGDASAPAPSRDRIPAAAGSGGVDVAGQLATPRFSDGAAAWRAATATTRLGRPPMTLSTRPDVGPTIDPAASRAPRSLSVLSELRQMEPQMARRLRDETLRPLLSAIAGLLDPRTFRQRLSIWMMRNRSEIVDDFGLDPVYTERVRPFFEFLYRRYFRVETRGMTNIPDQGRAMIVANHSGTLPYDAAMLMYGIRYDHPAHRTARPLVEDFVFHFPFLGLAMNRVGGVRASQQNAERLLADEQLVVVFPEGIKGIGKLYQQRYHLQRFGRGGFIRLALRTRTPIIPTAVVGAEEIHPLLTKVNWLTKQLGVPFIPITPTFPLLGLLGAVPLPSKWHILFGEPIQLAKEYDANAEGDRILVNRINEEIRAKIQTMLDECLANRTSSFFG